MDQIHKLQVERRCCSLVQSDRERQSNDKYISDLPCVPKVIQIAMVNTGVQNEGQAELRQATYLGEDA